MRHPPIVREPVSDGKRTTTAVRHDESSRTRRTDAHAARGPVRPDLVQEDLCKGFLEGEIRGNGTAWRGKQTPQATGTLPLQATYARKLAAKFGGVPWGNFSPDQIPRPTNPANFGKKLLPKFAGELLMFPWRSYFAKSFPEKRPSLPFWAKLTVFYPNYNLCKLPKLNFGKSMQPPNFAPSFFA